MKCAVAKASPRARRCDTAHRVVWLGQIRCQGRARKTIKKITNEKRAVNRAACSQPSVRTGYAATEVAMIELATAAATAHSVTATAVVLRAPVLAVATLMATPS